MSNNDGNKKNNMNYEQMVLEEKSPEDKLKGLEAERDEALVHNRGVPGLNEEIKRLSSLADERKMSVIDEEIKKLTSDISKFEENYPGNSTADDIIDLKAEIITALEEIKGFIAKKMELELDDKLSETEKTKIEKDMEDKKESIEKVNEKLSEAEEKLIILTNY